MEHPEDQLSLSLSSLNVTDKELDSSLSSLNQNSLILALSSKDPKDKIDLTKNYQSIDQSEISISFGKNLQRSSIYPQIKPILQNKSIEDNSFSQSMLTESPETVYKRIEIPNSRIEETQNLSFTSTKAPLCKQNEKYYCLTENQQNKNQSSEPFTQSNIGSKVVNSILHTVIQGKQIETQRIEKNPTPNLLPKLIFSYNDIFEQTQIIRQKYFQMRLNQTKQIGNLVRVSNQQAESDPISKGIQKLNEMRINYFKKVHYNSQLQFLQNVFHNNKYLIVSALISTKQSVRNTNEKLNSHPSQKNHQQQPEQFKLSLSNLRFDMEVMLDLKWTNLIELKLNFCGIDRWNWELLSKSVKKFLSLCKLYLSNFSFKKDGNFISTIIQSDLSQFYELKRFQVLSLSNYRYKKVKNPFDQQTLKLLEQKSLKNVNENSFELLYYKNIIQFYKNFERDKYKILQSKGDGKTLNQTQLKQLLIERLKKKCVVQCIEKLYGMSRNEWLAFQQI